MSPKPNQQCCQACSTSVVTTQQSTYWGRADGIQQRLMGLGWFAFLGSSRTLTAYWKALWNEELLVEQAPVAGRA
jgi:hypothetical protein